MMGGGFKNEEKPLSYRTQRHHFPPHSQHFSAVPDGRFPGDTASASLALRPHGLLVNLRVYQRRCKRRLNNLKPKGLEERHVLLGRER